MNPSWTHRALGPRLRPWQTHAVEALLARLAARGDRVCLVAPPGAGKTVCSLAVAAAIGAPVEVRVPTTALAEQWEDRVRQLLVATVDGAPPAPVRVATYAADAPFAADALVILDEAHHLTATWGAEVGARLLPAHRVLALTATPPEGAAGWERYLAITGHEPIEVAAPPLVRDGQLCPFADLVWPVLVDLDDLAPLRALGQALTALEERVALRFGVWEQRRLRDDIWELTEARFSGESGLLVALCRLRHARGVDLPADVVPDAELRAPPTLHDRALALWAFDPDGTQVLEGLRAAGFRIRAQGGPVLAEDIAWRTLTGTRARLTGALEVLALEHAARGDGLRALVVCDRDVEGDRLSAREVLKALVADAHACALDPILVTGTAFWVDEDLWPRVRERVPEQPWRSRDGHHEVDVTGWSTANRVSLATRLLDSGATRCLVGTRHLLGEGWDCPAVNVVIDLTGITTPVTVNQVRGRALRPHPDDPSKVSSLWDILALAPGAPDGDRMLAELEARHRSTFGVDAEGRIRTGVGRVDPLLEGSYSAILLGLEGIRERARARAADPAATAARWAVGRDYRDARVWTAGGAPPAARPHVPSPPAVRPAGPESIPRVLLDAEDRLQRALYSGAVAGTLLGAGAGATGALLGPVAMMLAGAVGLFGALGTATAVGLRRRAARRATVDRYRAIVVALHAALSEVAPDLGPLQRDGQTWWVEGAGSRRFAYALAELLGPVRAPRYLLIEGTGAAWPVPEELAARRELADALVQAWCASVGPAATVYARNPEGRAILRTLWRAGSAAQGDVRVVETWE